MSLPRPPILRHLGAGLCALYLLSVFPPLAFATHEVAHRFTVYGSVREGASFPGRLLSAQPVVARDATTGQMLQRGVTDQEGRYRLVLHIHNDGLGRQIVVSCQNSQTTITVDFDPNDTVTERQKRVDLVVFPK
jgi:hypothetical protein